MKALWQNPVNSQIGPELLIAAGAIALFFAMPNQLSFLSQIAIAAIFVLSLDFAMGYAGILTLGHAAFFGAGAYAAGLYAVRVTGEPLSGLLVGAFAGAFIALVSGAIVMRAVRLTQLMMTIAFAQILLEIANKWRSVTGGDDGLYGIQMSPVLGLFRFDFAGQTAFFYSTILLLICFALLRRLVASPFGLTAMGIREDRIRMASLGCNVYGHLLAVYVVAGFFAGLAGAIAAQTAQVVGLTSLGFAWSAEALVMLVLGGMGRLWGAVIGTVLFMMVHHYAAAVDPFRWMFVIGAMLILVVLVVPGGLTNSFQLLRDRYFAEVRK